MLDNCKNGISSYEIARDVKVTQKSAWFMLQRIRLAMQDDFFGKLGGEVEVDETFIGGKARNMHLPQSADASLARIDEIKLRRRILGAWRESSYSVFENAASITCNRSCGNMLKLVRRSTPMH